jgi:hypothetical protein
MKGFINEKIMEMFWCTFIVLLIHYVKGKYLARWLVYCMIAAHGNYIIKYTFLRWRLLVEKISCILIFLWICSY